jgi:type II secretion system protein I
MTRRRRRAFSLFEVILALAILAGAVAVLSQLTRSGLENARLARDLTLAQLYCESKMAEIAAGLAPAESQQGVPFEDADGPATLDWTYTVEVNPAVQTGLLEVRVTVSQDPAVQSQPVEYTLVRWMPDPNAAASSEASSTGGAEL